MLGGQVAERSWIVETASFAIYPARCRRASRIRACAMPDRLERENAVGTAAIGDDLSVFRKFTQATFQLGKRAVECTVGAFGSAGGRRVAE